MTRTHSKIKKKFSPTADYVDCLVIRYLRYPLYLSGIWPEHQWRSLLPCNWKKYTFSGAKCSRHWLIDVFQFFFMKMLAHILSGCTCRRPPTWDRKICPPHPIFLTSRPMSNTFSSLWKIFKPKEMSVTKKIHQLNLLMFKPVEIGYKIRYNAMSEIYRYPRILFWLFN